MPTVAQVISSLPPVPDPLNDDQATYSLKASAFTQALLVLATQLQAWTNQVNAIAVGAAYGLSYVYSATTAAADPGSGKLRLNNAALGSATALYLSETDNNGGALQSLLASWTTGSQTIKGALRIVKGGNAAIYADYYVTGALTDNGTWDTLTLSYIGSAGALVDGDGVVLQYQRQGADGVSATLTSPTRTVGASANITSADNGYNVLVSAAGVTLTCDTPAAMSGSSVYFLAGPNGVLLTGTFYNVADGTSSSQTRAVPRGCGAILTSDGTGLHLEILAPTSIFEQNVEANYSTQLVDAGTDIWHASAVAHTYTINGALAYPVGTVLMFTNLNASLNLSIAISTDAMRQANTANVGTRTLGPNGGVATVRKVAAGQWIITGTGVS